MEGLSPFNADRTPSFFVNDQKQRYFDFSSGKNGNIFDFLHRDGGAVLSGGGGAAANEAGVTLPRFTPEMEEREKKVTGLIEVMSLQRPSSKNPCRSAARRRRGAISLGAICSRRCNGSSGSAMRRGALCAADHLAGKGVAPELMIEAGLLVHGEEIAVPYDRFRDRVMFPIADARGRIIAFGGGRCRPMRRRSI